MSWTALERSQHTSWLPLPQSSAKTSAVVQYHHMPLGAPSPCFWLPSGGKASPLAAKTFLISSLLMMEWSPQLISDRPPFRPANRPATCQWQVSVPDSPQPEDNHSCVSPSWFSVLNLDCRGTSPAPSTVGALFQMFLPWRLCLSAFSLLSVSFFGFYSSIVLIIVSSTDVSGATLCPRVALQPLGYNTCLQSICNLPVCLSIL